MQKRLVVAARGLGVGGLRTIQWMGTRGCSVVVVHGVDTNAIRAIWDRGRAAGAQRASMLSIVSRGNYPKSVADSVLEVYGPLACGLKSAGSYSSASSQVRTHHEFRGQAPLASKLSKVLQHLTILDLPFTILSA